MLCAGAAYDASKTDPQLEALLLLKAAIDSTNVLQDWTRSSGTDGGYCSWQGVQCRKGSTTVYSINLWQGAGISGLQGYLPAAAVLVGLPGLTHICISDQKGITGILPEDWSRLTQLTDVRLANNLLTGSIPASWGKLAKLTVLMLYMNRLSGQIPVSFNALTALESLEMGRNAFTGSIPDFSKLTSLRVLFLNNNKLAGTIPGSLKALTSLEKLELASNALLGGTLPAWLGYLRSLELMTLHSSNFSGSIPAAFGNLNSLRVLYMGDNQLTGTLPDALKALGGLEELGLEDNALVGTVPASWSALRSLRQVWLSNNQGLKGCLPSTWKRQLSGWDVEENVYAGTGIRSFC
jgi:Leucine-rich repeat (LRR) protein